MVAAAEWAELGRPAPELRGFLRSHIQLPGLKWHQFSPEPTDDPTLAPFTESLDLMGDGTLILLPTPGHTAGSVSLLIRRTARPPLLLAGDLSYEAEMLHRGLVPGVGNRRELTESRERYSRWQSSRAGPGRAARPRPNSRPAATGQLTPEATMAAFQNTVTIARPANEVFAFLADFGNIPAWNYAIARTVQTSPGQPGWVPPTGRPAPSPAAARKHSRSPNSRHRAGSAIKGQIGPFNATSSYLLEPAAGGTRLTNDVELEPSSALLRPFGPLAVPRVKAAVARNLGTLKQLLEGTRPAAEGDQQ